jgi:hypothetical protein
MKMGEEGEESPLPPRCRKRRRMSTCRWVMTVFHRRRGSTVLEQTTEQWEEADERASATATAASRLPTVFLGAIGC